MGVFTDSTYQSLDWISQATEPINSPLTALMAKIPDHITISPEMMRECITISHCDTFPRIELDVLVECICDLYAKEEYQQLEHIHDIIEKQFKMELPQGKIRINYTEDTIVGELVLVKVSSHIDEAVIKKSLGIASIRVVNQLTSIGSSPDRSGRAVEVLEILGSMSKKDKTYNRRILTIIYTLEDIFYNDKWKIRDAVLANKIGIWISDYIMYGKIAALSNLYKIKVMTHKGLPIYSMEEII